MHLRQFLAFSLVAAVGAAACGDGGEKKQPGPPAPVIELVVDANRNGVLEPGDPSEMEGRDGFSATAGAIFLANLDDDDGSGRPDASDEVVNGDDDVLDLAPIAVRAWPEAPEGTVGLLALDAAGLANARLFRVDGPPELASSYRVESQPAAIALSTEELRAGVRLALEGKRFVTSTAPGAWDGLVALSLDVQDAAGETLGSDLARLRVAPVLLPFNTAPTEEVYFSDLGIYNRDFAAGIREMTDELSLPLVGLRPRDDDPWTQDFFEVGTTSMPGPGGEPVGMKVAIRSPQPDRVAGRVVDSHFAGPDFATVFLHATNWDPYTAGYSMSSFGNWEVVPPYGDYPLGRNIWGQGSRAGEKPDAVFVDFVRAQRVQPEIVVDTSWLLVGHVDEVFSWVQADTARGWRLLEADPALAREMLLDLQQAGHGSARLFEGKTWVDWESRRPREIPAAVSIDAILADPDLAAASQEAQVHIEEMRARLVEETGLSPEEITPMPFLFESMMGALVAHQPGTVNLLHVDGHVVIADPFGPVVDGVDVFRADLEDRLGAHGLQVYFTDNWDIYHRNLGEVHCGSNVARRIDLRWWESGR